MPVLALADADGLATFAGEHLSVPGDKGPNAGLKVASVVVGMVAGARSIEETSARASRSCGPKDLPTGERVPQSFRSSRVRVIDT